MITNPTVVREVRHILSVQATLAQRFSSPAGLWPSLTYAPPPRSRSMARRNGRPDAHLAMAIGGRLRCNALGVVLRATAAAPRRSRSLKSGGSQPICKAVPRPSADTQRPWPSG